MGQALPPGGKGIIKKKAILLKLNPEWNKIYWKKPLGYNVGFKYSEVAKELMSLKIF